MTESSLKMSIRYSKCPFGALTDKWEPSCLWKHVGCISRSHLTRVAGRCKSAFYHEGYWNLALDKQDGAAVQMLKDTPMAGHHTLNGVYNAMSTCLQMSFCRGSMFPGNIHDQALMSFATIGMNWLSATPTAVSLSSPTESWQYLDLQKSSLLFFQANTWQVYGAISYLSVSFGAYGSPVLKKS